MNQQNKYSDEYINAYIDGELDYEERTRLLFDEQTDPDLAHRINETRMLKEKVQLTYLDVKNGRDGKKSFSCIVLNKSVGSQKIMQALDAPGKFKNLLITNKVTTQFLNSPCTLISYLSFLRSTDFFRTIFTGWHRALVASLLLLSIVMTLFVYDSASKNNLILAQQLIKNTQAVSADEIGDVINDHKRIIINVSQYNPQRFHESVNSIEALLQKHNNDKSFAIEIVANGQGLKALDIETSIHAERIEQLANQFASLELVACAKSLAALATEGDPIQLMKSIMITPSAAQQVARRTGQGWLFIKI